MGAKSKSRLSKIDRVEFLKDHGWSFARSGKGDHNIWEHLGLKELAKTQKIDCPLNLLSNVAQAPWENTVPDNPAEGTWRSIAKLALWAEDTVAEAQGKRAALEARRQLKTEFRENLADMTAWRHDIKRRYKMNQMDTAPAAPVTSAHLAALQAKLKP